MRFRNWERVRSAMTPADLCAAIDRAVRVPGETDRVRGRLALALTFAQYHEWGACADALDKARDDGGCDLDDLVSSALRLESEQAARELAPTPAEPGGAA